jgi:hypothetical protein
MLLDLLRADGSIVVNKRLAKEIGLHEAIVLSEAISRYAYHKDRNELTDEGYFYFTVEKMEEYTTLSSHQQRKALTTLKGLGFLDFKKQGMPSKRFIKVNEKAIVDFLLSELSTESTGGNTPQSPSNQEVKKLNNKKLKNSTTSGEKIEPQEVKKLNTSNTNNNTELNNTKDNNKSISLKEVYTQDIGDMYENKEMPVYILRVLDRNIDRLIDLSISPLDILSFYKSSDRTVNDNDFAEILSRTIKKDVKNFTAYMKTAIKNWYAEYEGNLMPNVGEDEDVEIDTTKYSTDHLPEYLQWDWLNEGGNN